MLGLQDCDYIDLVDQNELRTQRGAITVDGELGRIFLSNQSTCVIEDASFNRCIKIEKNGSNSTSVWSPGLALASKMDDLGAVCWRSMVCVEVANALKNRIEIKSMQSHTISAKYSVFDM